MVIYEQGHRDSDRMEAYGTDNASVSISQHSQYDLPVTCAISISKAEEKKRFMENKIVAQRKVTRPAISQFALAELAIALVELTCETESFLFRH